jgi:hypothetical protein
MFFSGSTLHYTMTGEPAAPITIQRTNAWLPNAFLTEIGSFLDTPTTQDVGLASSANVKHVTIIEMRKLGVQHHFRALFNTHLPSAPGIQMRNQ